MSRRLLAVAALLLCGSCEFFFPLPKRPSVDGFVATLIGDVDGKTVTRRVAVRGLLERSEWGNEGRRRIRILRPDLGELWELREDERIARVRPLQESDRLIESRGFYPLQAIPFREFDPHTVIPEYPDHELSAHVLSDEVVGFHPCDVIRFDRQEPDGSGLSEYWYFARDFDGVVVRREVVEFSDGLWGDLLETWTMEQARIEADPELFEVPAGWTIERTAAPPSEPAEGSVERESPTVHGPRVAPE